MPESYKVIIQLSDDSVDVQHSVISQVNNLVRALPSIHIELVIHSRGINFIYKSCQWENQLNQLIKQYNVKIYACNNTLEAMQLSKEDLLPIVEIVPSAVAHIVMKQHEGWSYLKAGF